MTPQHYMVARGMTHLRRACLCGVLCSLGALCGPAGAAPAHDGAAGAAIAITTVDLSPSYACDPEKEFEQAFAPESAAQQAGVTWRQEEELADGAIDLADYYTGAATVALYARVRLQASAPGKITLSLGSNGGVIVIANGKRVFSKNVNRALKANEDATDVALAAGTNELLLRATRNGGGFNLQLAAKTVDPITVTQDHAMDAHKASFTFTLPTSALSSAGIYDAAGRLVRHLWNERQLAKGRHTYGWDGLDEFGQPAPDGPYTFKVVSNRAVYANVSAIGSNVKPFTVANHIPTAMHDVAVDGEGAIYTANYWDEAGADFKKWDKDGNSVYDARYQMRNGNPNGAPYALTTDDKYLYCAMEGWAGAPWNNKQQVQRFRISDGALVPFSGLKEHAGHIQIYEWPDKLIPAGAPDADKPYLHWPLRAIAVQGDVLLVADTLGGRVLKFHKDTGLPLGEFAVKLPVGLAVAADGSIWIAHERHNVSHFSKEGQLLQTVLTDVKEVKNIALGVDGKLYVADAGAGQVKIYTVTGNDAKLVQTLGQPAQPGGRAADHFYSLRGVGVDRLGNIITIQNEPTSGSRVARWSPEGKLLWEKFSTVFVSLANYGAFDPSTLYSMHFHRYSLLKPDEGTWAYSGNLYSGTGSEYSADVHGVPQILKLGGNIFVYYPTGDGVQVYRITQQKMLLAALVGGNSPAAPGGPKGGKWTWARTGGDALPKAEEVSWYKKPGEPDANFSAFGMHVDRQGNIWVAELSSAAIWKIPLLGLNAAGNPRYDWAEAKIIVPRDTSPALRFNPSTVQCADDGSIYAVGFSDCWASPKNNPFWMGGTTLAHFDKTGQRLWAVRLPSVCVGLDIIPDGGGCMVGSGSEAAVYHYDADGLRLGTLRPGAAMDFVSGWLDNNASVAVNRDTRDGKLDIFTEDDLVLRIGWFRVEDRNRISTVSGRLALGVKH